jgi:glycosyltransferase involved in cell wall biosynthesis
MNKVSILFAIDSVAFDAGTERQLAEIITRIDRERFETHLCCLQDSTRLRELAMHCRILLLPAERIYSPRGLVRFWQLHRYIRANRIDVVHTFMFKSSLLAIIAARGSGCRAVISSRRNLGYLQTPAQLRILRYLDRYTTRLLANSEAARQFAIRSEGVAPGRVDVLYNGVDLVRCPATSGTSVAASIGIPAGAKVVGIVANLRPVKNLALFLRAARLVAAKAPDAAFVIVGAGPLRQELGRLASELGIDDRVFFADGRGTVQDYLCRMSVGCLSSESEGFSNAILEYMAAGLPVVATDVGGNSEAIESGITGYLVRESAPAAFAAPILELLSDEPKRAAMGKRSLERCRRLFDMDQAVRRLEDYYLSLLGAAPSRTSYSTRNG